MLPSETMIWQPEFTDKTLSRKPGAVQPDVPSRHASSPLQTDIPPAPQYRIWAIGINNMDIINT
ncbi:hypothetical protein, partial [Escherichia coli]|uniref:hypothetical protein n=1 Tax=Escherichia coli TaxID=562 RepID=UPI001BEC4F73